MSVNFQIESELQTKGYKVVAGIDECGVGCLSGIILACAVVLTENLRGIEVRDSKAYPSHKSREKALEKLKPYIVAKGFGRVAVEEINKQTKTIPQYTTLARKRAYLELRKQIQPDVVLIDYFEDELEGTKVVGVRKGDGEYTTVGTVAAASVVGKVVRDRLMIKESVKYPMYDWEHNMGYRSPKHLRALRKYGPSPLHRLQYHDVVESLEWVAR